MSHQSWSEKIYRIHWSVQGWLFYSWKGEVQSSTLTPISVIWAACRLNSEKCRVVWACLFAEYLVETVVRLQDDAARHSSQVFPFSIAQVRPWNRQIKISGQRRARTFQCINKDSEQKGFSGFVMFWQWLLHTFCLHWYLVSLEEMLKSFMCNRQQLLLSFLNANIVLIKIPPALVFFITAADLITGWWVFCGFIKTTESQL